MNIPQGLFKFYGPRIYRDTDDKGGGGGNPDQTNWKAQYETLKAQIDSGQYVSKESYVTLQRNLEAAVNEKKSAVGDLENARAKIALYDDDKQTLQRQIGELQTSNSQLDADNKAKGMKLERHNVIFKDFPHLAPFVDDIREPKEGEKYEDLLKTFGDRVTSIGTKALEDFRKGSTTPPPTREDEKPKGSAVLLKEANAFMGQGKTKEYEAKMDEYHKVKAQEAGTA